MPASRTDNGNGSDMQTRAARIRVARAYAKRNQQEIADHLGVHLQTVKRMEKGDAPISDDRLFAIGSFCGIPERFMTVGFDTDMDIVAELEETRRERDAMRDDFTAAIERYAEASEFGRQIAERLRPTEDRSARNE